MLALSVIMHDGVKVLKIISLLLFRMKSIMEKFVMNLVWSGSNNAMCTIRMLAIMVIWSALRLLGT